MKDEEDRGEAIIPEEDFREAIAACSEDPLLKRYFTLAPPGAKLFIGLGFYSTHFGDKVDPRQYAECQAEIEPALTVNDLKYLIRFEEDKNTKRYLRGLLEKREAEEAENLPELDREEDSPTFAQDGDSIPVPRRKVRRHNRISAMQWLSRDDSSGWFPRFCKIAAVLAVFPCIALLLYLNDSEKDEPQTLAAKPEQTANSVTGSVEDASLPDPGEALAGRIEPSAPPLAPTGGVALVSSCSATGNVANAALMVERDSAQGIGGSEPERSSASRQQYEEQPVEQQTEHVAGADDQPARKAKRRPKVVFTDGRKIVRRQGGRIEVPRVFSSIGAGVKPFWVYGRNPEADAEKERLARAEWNRLCEIAREEESRQ